MTDEKKSHKAQITVAAIGLVGVLGSGMLANWDKLFLNNEPPQPHNSSSTVVSNETIISLPPSFDCRNATTKIEKVICNNAEISHVDGQLGLLYVRLRNKLNITDFKTLKKEQKLWIRNRDERVLKYCQGLAGLNVNCVNEIYGQRIAEFKKILVGL